MIGIYMYENKINHKKYIGQSINILKRKWEHLHQPSKTSYFDNVLSKIGEDQFIFSIIEECEASLLDEKEKYWIKYYHTYIKDPECWGYNLTEGGQAKNGELNPFAKLNEYEVKQIIQLLEEHIMNNEEIAKIFNVCRNTIDNINRCQTWKHLHNYQYNIRQENLNKLKNIHSSFAGENNPSNKIKEEDVIKIIELLKTDQRSIAQLSRDLQININILYDINRCRTWKYLHKYEKNIRNEYRQGVVR